MARLSKQEPEFWLSTGFLADEDLALEAEILKKNNALNADLALSLSFPMEVPYEFDSFGSSLSSPGESVVGSTETESGGEDDFLTGLTRRLNHSSISETRKLGSNTKNKWVMAGSPESTLSGTGHWSVSSNGSPSGVSPPVTPFGGGYNARDLIYEAAGQVARLKMNNEALEAYNSSNFQARKPLQNQVTSVRDASYSAFCEAHGFAHNVSQMNQQYERARLEQLLRQHQQKHYASVLARQVNLNRQINCGGQRASGFENGRRGHPATMGMPALSVWHCLQQDPLHQSQQFPAQSRQLKQGMKTTVLGGSGVKRECAGTGVFLPRRYGNNPEPRKKIGCSSAIIPAKVVHALNTSFEGMNAHPRTQSAFDTLLTPADYEAMVARRNELLSLQKRMLQQENHHELGLPQEWTY